MTLLFHLAVIFQDTRSWPHPCYYACLHLARCWLLPSICHGLTLNPRCFPPLRLMIWLQVQTCGMLCYPNWHLLIQFNFLLPVNVWLMTLTGWSSKDRMRFLRILLPSHLPCSRSSTSNSLQQRTKQSHWNVHHKKKVKNVQDESFGRGGKTHSRCFSLTSLISSALCF